MEIAVLCLNCKRRFFVTEDLVGRRVMCPHCPNAVRVPWPDGHARQAPPARGASKPPRSLSLGVASLALGALAVMALCLPVVGYASFVLSGTGLGLGLCGLACSGWERAGVGAPRTGRGLLAGRAVDFPMAGVAVCLLALVLAGLPFLLP
jgi:hypothetical protein